MNNTDKIKGRRVSTEEKISEFEDGIIETAK